MSRFLRSLAVVVAALVGASAAVPAFADPVAVVAAVKGKVEITTPKAKGGTRAVFGRALERGDKVTVGPGGAATLFFNDGNVIELAERSAITIGGRLASGPRAAAIPSDVYAQISRYVTSGSRQTGLVTMPQMRSDADDNTPLLLAPRRTSILTDAPEFSWRAVPGATHYRVHVATAEGAELWSRDVPAHSGEGHELRAVFTQSVGGRNDLVQYIAYPTDVAKLTGNADIEWEVQALDAKGTLRRESTIVRVLSPTALDDVRANLTKIADGVGGHESAAARYLAGTYLAGLGIYPDAAEQFRALTALAPESPGPHEALGNVYLSVGLVDLAASEFQQALALQRDSR